MSFHMPSLYQVLLILIPLLVVLIRFRFSTRLRALFDLSHPETSFLVLIPSYTNNSKKIWGINPTIFCYAVMGFTFFVIFSTWGFNYYREWQKFDSEATQIINQELLQATFDGTAANYRLDLITASQKKLSTNLFYFIPSRRNSFTAKYRAQNYLAQLKQALADHHVTQSELDTLLQ